MQNGAVTHLEFCRERPYHLAVTSSTRVSLAQPSISINVCSIMMISMFSHMPGCYIRWSPWRTADHRQIQRHSLLRYFPSRWEVVSCGWRGRHRPGEHIIKPPMLITYKFCGVRNTCISNSYLRYRSLMQTAVQFCVSCLGIAAQCTP